MRQGKLTSIINESINEVLNEAAVSIDSRHDYYDYIWNSLYFTIKDDIFQTLSHKEVDYKYLEGFLDEVAEALTDMFYEG